MLAACASDASVGTSFDPLERFPPTALWRWHEIRNVPSGDERIVALDLGPDIEGVISAEFSARSDRERRERLRKIAGRVLVGFPPGSDG